MSGVREAVGALASGKCPRWPHTALERLTGRGQTLTEPMRCPDCSTHSFDVRWRLVDGKHIEVEATRRPRAEGAEVVVRARRVSIHESDTGAEVEYELYKAILEATKAASELAGWTDLIHG
jgi:hypothetical protein